MKVFFDTNLFIYLWEGGNSPRKEAVERIVAAIEAADGMLVTSSLTLGEILVHPMRRGAEAAVRAYVDRFERLELVAFDTTCALLFAEIRARLPKVRPPDAIQLACAAKARCRWFLTNDGRLSEARIPGIARCASYDAFEA
jgi:predicted nucleic acid-binding protein